MYNSYKIIPIIWLCALRKNYIRTGWVSPVKCPYDIMLYGILIIISQWFFQTFIKSLVIFNFYLYFFLPEHDFRSVDSDRRVNFKTNRTFNKPLQNKDWSNSVRHYLQEEDIDMGAQNINGRVVNNKNRRKGGRQGPPQPNRHMKRKLLGGPNNWFRVIVSKRNVYNKKYYS